MRFVLIITLLLSFSVNSQHYVGELFEEMPSDTVLPLSVENHTSILPSIRNVQRSHQSKDSNSSFISVTGLVDLGYRYTEHSEYRLGGGLRIESSIRNKFHFVLNGIQGTGSADSVFSSKAYIVLPKNQHYLYTDLRGRISYTPNDIFNFQVGLDHNFIGEGNRSLFLSDYGKPYPFAMIRARFWRLEYSVLYQFFREEVKDMWRMKNAATHHISFNATKWLNLGIFETVIFQPKDTMLYRGFDVEYLNPVIFYRPQEYSMGSSDNVLLGASVTAKFRKMTFYGQFIIDEFSLTEIRAKTKWWANKFGFQSGVKGRFEIGKNKFFYRTEFNFVRPYTYAHLNSGQNYGNMGSTLAHPYGSNFYEILGEMKMQKNRWTLKSFVSYFLHGRDKDGYSYGGYLYSPYDNRPILNGGIQNYGHFTGQGVGNNGFRGILTLSYQLVKNGNMQVFFENQYRYDSVFQRSSYVPLIGIRSQLWNDHRNY